MARVTHQKSKALPSTESWELTTPCLEPSALNDAQNCNYTAYKADPTCGATRSARQLIDTDYAGPGYSNCRIRRSPVPHKRGGAFFLPPIAEASAIEEGVPRLCRANLILNRSSRGSPARAIRRFRVGSAHRPVESTATSLS
jgi:hypothetical protein